MNILVTGGLGFIGSHTVVELIKAGHTPIVVDNLSNSSIEVLGRLERLTGHKIRTYVFDVSNRIKLNGVFDDENIDSVIHFAAFKAVGESVSEPLKYYRNNIEGLLTVLQVMEKKNVNYIVFSSSCTIYGEPDKVPIDEDAPFKPTTNPYGETKQMAERILNDVATESNLRVVSLRYFNPIGAHPSSLIGELPNGTPNCLVPYITQATARLRLPLTVFGTDYTTPDGSGVRDYIHVVDLARAHLNALMHLKKQKVAIDYFNIGTGKGISVLELINTFEKVNSVKVPHKIGPRRQGDVACIFADPSKARRELGWKAEKSLEDALRDAWNWQISLNN